MLDAERLLKELLETFRVEAQDHLQALTALLLEMEKESEPAGRKQHVESVFRRMHTLKGAAHAVNLIDVAQRCQELEDLLAELKRGDLQLYQGIFDRLHADLDALTELIFQEQEKPEEGGGTTDDGEAAGKQPEKGAVSAEPAKAAKAPVPAAAEGAATSALPVTGVPSVPSAPEAPLAEAGPAPSAAGTPERRPAAGAKPAAGETVRISVRLLESLLLQSEELVSAKLAASTLHEELAAAAARLSAQDAERARALDLARETLRQPQPDPQAAKLAALLQHCCSTERDTAQRLRLLEKSSEKNLWALRAMVDPLLDEMKKLHLLPFSTLTDPFAKLVRDLGRELDKEAELACLGCELEIDRRILAELKEPLLHLVRNVMDHGIEKEQERLAAGKPAKGRICMEVRLQDGNRAEVVLSDDGCGINVAQVKGAALRLELLSPEALERISDADALQLIFESGVSTSRIITSLSGRGVGLAIVRESLERLGGHVTVDSRPGQGTEFRLCLPLSFAMMPGLLVQATGRACMLPAANVEVTTRVAPGAVKRVENRDTVVIGGEVISLISLSRLLELDDRGAESPDGFQPVVLLSLAEKRIAFAVDQIHGVSEVLVKPLGSQLSRVRNVAGATVLGDGRVVPVLNVGDLFRSALLSASSAPSAPPPSAAKARRLSVLVAEDSITSRTLLKNILESSGFLVRTAIDGADALAQVKSEPCDVVISDVEMPRMDGFQLTAAIRRDSKLAELPVILVTGLESRSDRERGIEVGANAYIVKSSFDQGSLIEVIEKLT